MNEFKRHWTPPRARFCLIIPCVLSFAVDVALGEVPDEAAVREAIAERLKSIRSIIVTYDVEHIYSPENLPGGTLLATQMAASATQPLRDNRGMSFRLKTGTDRSSNRF